MSYNTQQDILDFVEDNNVKFVRFAFCDIFGTQKNIAVLASDLPKAMEDGVCFDGSSIAGRGKAGRRCLWRQLPRLPAPDEPQLPQTGADLQRGG